MLLEVMESMLGNICQSHVLVFPNGSLLGFELTDQQLNRSGLPCPICSDNSYTGCHAGSQGNIFHNIVWPPRIFKRNISHLQDGAAARFHSFQYTREWENPRLVLVR
jgi:hypothetical protein